MKEKQKLKILLLQIRDDSIVRAEEVQSFALHSGLGESQIHIHNVFDHPQFDTDIVSGFDALFIGGASEASVLEEDRFTFLHSGYKLIHYCLEHSIPTFASCFGFQMAIMAFGGTITRDTSDYEMGTCDIHRTQLGESDLLFQALPSTFKAVSVHQEKATILPVNCELLAQTDNCLGYTGLPFVSLNLEYRKLEYENYKVSDISSYNFKNFSINEIFLSVSLPLEF